MKRKYVSYLFYSFIIFMLGIVGVDALTVNLSKDLISASESSSARFYINTAKDFSSSSYFQSKAFGGYADSSNKSAKVSVKNGDYYVWSYDALSQRINSGSPVLVKVTNSCTNQKPQTNKTGTFTVERCFYKVKGDSEIYADEDGTVIASCASGYKITATKTTTDTCSSMSLDGLSKRYCKRVFQFTCSKSSGSSEDPGEGGETPTVAAAKLSKLSLDGASISPSFKASTKKYTATVEANVSKIKVNATAASGGTLVKNYGSRTVNLAYGKNTIKVKVKNSAGTVTTYTITVTRKDNRSAVNTLSNLTVSSGTLSPAFSSDKTSYSISVDNSVSSLTVNATLTDGKSKFASGFGPRTVALKEGTNQVYIKVTSEKGVTKTYTITVNRGTVSSVCSLNDGELALLKGIEVQANDLTPIVIEDFDPLKKDYDSITVPFEIKNLTVLPLVQDEGDTYEVEGTNDLEVNIPREIKITVTSKACPDYKTIYTLVVTRLSEEEGGGIADIKSMTIKNHKEFKFEKNVLDYKIILKKGEDKLEIDYETEDPNTKCTILDNENLKYSSVVEISCISEDEVDNVTYTITVDGIEKGVSSFWVILIIIIIIICLILLVMRLLGYKIYFNMEAVKAAFRGMGEKARNTFDK